MRNPCLAAHAASCAEKSSRPLSVDPIALRVGQTYNCKMEHTNTPALDLSWDEAIALSEKLALEVQKYCTDNRTAVDLLVILPVGGLIPGERVARILGLGDLDVAFASVAAYKPNEAAPSGHIETGQLPAREQVAGKRVWIIDEVCDTGVTLEYVIKLLRSYGAADIHTAALHFKPKKSTTGVKPDIYMAETDAKWINYPWEVTA